MRVLVLLALTAAACARAPDPVLTEASSSPRDARQAFLQQPLQRIFAQNLESQQRVLPRPQLVQFIKLEPRRVQVQRVEAPIIVGPRLVQQDLPRLRIQPQLIQRVDPLPASLQSIPSRPQIIQAIPPQLVRRVEAPPPQFIQKVEAPPQLIQDLEAPPQIIQRVDPAPPQIIQRVVEAPPRFVQKIEAPTQILRTVEAAPQIIQRIQPQIIQVQRVQPIQPQIVRVQAQPQVVQIQEQHLGQQTYASAYTGPQYRIIQQVQEIDPAGYYRYNFITENGIVVREQGTVTSPGTQAESTAKQGSYTYQGDDGQQYSVEWVADENGFRASGAHLPTPPPIPEEIQRSLELNANDPTQYDEQGFPINARR